MICIYVYIMYFVCVCIDVVVSKIVFFTPNWASDPIWLFGLKPSTYVYIYIIGQYFCWNPSDMFVQLYTFHYVAM